MLDYDVPARYGDRPSDEIVDTMMQGLALARYHEDPDWDFSSVFKALKRTAEYLEEFGIKDYCVQTIAELACWESMSPRLQWMSMDRRRLHVFKATVIGAHPVRPESSAHRLVVDVTSFDSPAAFTGSGEEMLT